MTARLSAASATRRLTRSGQFARRASRTTPATRCGPEHQVHAEGTSSCRDVREDGVQLWMIAEQRGELVDDDHEPRKLHARIEDVARAAARQFGLAPSHLGAEALDRTAGARSVEIGDDAR